MNKGKSQNKSIFRIMVVFGTIIFISVGIVMFINFQRNVIASYENINKQISNFKKYELVMTKNDRDTLASISENNLDARNNMKLSEFPALNNDLIDLEIAVKKNATKETSTLIWKKFLKRKIPDLTDNDFKTVNEIIDKLVFNL